MGALRSDGINDVVSLPAGSTSNVGTTAYTWWIKGTLRTAPSGLAGILGTSSVSASSGFATNATLQLRVYSAGTNRYGTGDNFFEVGVYHHYRLEHDAGGAWRAYRDDMVTPVASGTFTGSFTFASLNQMFRSSSSSAMWTAWDMEEMGITSTTFSETYQANLSAGTGSILPTVSGNNQGNLVNFPTDDGQWIGFGTTYTVTGTGALTFGGAGNAVQWYVARGTSALTISGTGSAWQTPYAAGSGALTFGGVGAAVSDNAYRVSGVSVLNFAGAGAAWQTPYATGTSALVFGGVGAASTDSGSYSVSGIGQLTFGGRGAAVQWYVATGTSALTLSGTGTAWQTTYATGISTLTLSGTGSAWQTPYASGTSTLTFSGAGRVTSGDQQQYGIVRVPATAVNTHIRRTVAVSTKIRRAVDVNTVLRYNVAIN